MVTASCVFVVSHFETVEDVLLVKTQVPALQEDYLLDCVIHITKILVIQVIQVSQSGTIHTKGLSPTQKCACESNRAACL